MTSSQHPKRVDDFIVMGRYVVYVCILAEFMIIPQIGSMFYMVFAGVAPSIISCNGYQFDPKLENKEVCLLIKNMDNCTKPQLNYQFKSVNVEWNYICESSKMVKNSISIQMFGVLLGSVVFGQISDSFGRKLGMLVSLIGTLLGWLLVAQSVELTQFTITRTIVGFFTGGSIAVLNVFIMENIPKKHRMWINMAITWSPNLPPIALFAWISHSWDKLAYANALICVPPLLFCIFFINESPRWLITQCRIDEAREVMRREFKTSEQMELMNEEFEEVLLTEYEVIQHVNQNKRQYSYYHLFSTWKLTLTTTVLAFSYFSTSIINYGILFNMEKLSGSLYLNSVYTGLMRYCCNLTFGYADLKFTRIGRKFIHTSGLVVIILSLALVIVAYIFNLNHILKEEVRVAILLASSMTSQIYIADGIVGNELFPTPVRNLGYSFLQLWNRAGVIISPFVFYLADYWVALPYCVMTLLSLADTLAFECLLPETKGKPLIEHMPSREERILRGKSKKQATKSDILVDKNAEIALTVQ